MNEAGGSVEAVGANARHGLRRTNADKRRAVETLLNDEEWRGWSDREIAKRAGVSGPFVATMREALQTVCSAPPEPRKTSDGRVMNTANIGRRAEGGSPGFLEIDRPGVDPLHTSK